MKTHNLLHFYHFAKLKIAAVLLSVIIALVMFKGLFLLVSVLNTFFLGLSDSKGELAVSYISMVFFLLPGEVLLTLLIVFLTFRLSMKDALDWYKISGYVLSLVVIFYNGNFFLGQVGTFSIITDLFLGLILIGSAILELKYFLDKITTDSLSK